VGEEIVENVVHLSGESQVRLYRDGVEVAATTVTGDLGVSSSAPTLVGNASGGADVAYPGRSRDFQGMVDDVRIYDRALDADEIAILYNAPEA
jgi:hypothetical protein